MQFDLKLNRSQFFVTLYRIAIVYFLFQLTRVGFYLFNTNLFPEMTFMKLISYLFYGFIFDTTAILYINSLFLLLSLIPFLFRYNKVYQRILKWLFILTNSFALMFNVVDFIYYRFIFKRTTAANNSLANEDNVVKLFFRFIVDFWPATLSFIIVVIALVWLYNRVKPVRPRVENRIGYYLLSTLALFVVIVLSIGGVRGGFSHSTRPITISNAAKYVDKVEETAIVLNTPFSIIRTLSKDKIKKKTYFKTEEELTNEFTPYYEPIDTIPFTPKNVVVIILESFNREFSKFLNPKLNNGNYPGYCPFLDSLMQQGVTFTHAYANGRKSLDALPSVLASIPEMQVPYLLCPYSTNKINSLPGLLRKEGYSTSFFHGAHNGSMGFQAFSKTADIELYFGRENYDNDADYDGIWGIWDEPFLQFFAHKISTFKQPFFTSIFTLSSHHPFKVPEQYKGVFADGPVELCKCITYSDNALRKFFETASKTDWYKNTLFVITADHSTFPFHKEYTTLEKAFAIPIVYYSPAGDLQGLRNYETQQIDIFPTIMRYLHYSKPFIAYGNNALDSTATHYAFNSINGNYQITQNRMLLQYDGLKSIALYNLEADPMLTTNLINNPDQNVLINKLENRIKAIVQQYNNRLIDNKMVP